jgi:LPS O-antigen subunit length determinant protein (WzzB/FepE family)
LKKSEGRDRAECGFPEPGILSGAAEKALLADVKLEPFRYQLSPSMPVKKDGPGKALIVVLAALLGAVCLR